MCIIVVKQAGIKLPTLDVLEVCESGNPDGIGVMYFTSKGVRVLKGFKSSKTLHKFLVKNISIEQDAVVHFRFATQGAVNSQNCHPYPLSSKYADLSATNITHHSALVHNGIISHYSGVRKAKMSDTQKFIMSTMSDDVIYSNLDSPAIQELVLNTIGTGKLAIMQKLEGRAEKLYLLGDFITDSETGLLFSNDGYLFDWRGRSAYAGYVWDNKGRLKTTKSNYATKPLTTKELALIEEAQTGYEDYQDSLLPSLPDYCESCCMEMDSQQTLYKTDFGYVCQDCLEDLEAWDEDVYLSTVEKLTTKEKEQLT